jgi:hypothetical protein
MKLYFLFLDFDKAMAIACFLLLTLLPELDLSLRFLNSLITFAILDLFLFILPPFL